MCLPMPRAGNNHLCPEVKKTEWSEAEDRAILEGVAELGSRWCEIIKAPALSGRTDNAIKNRFYSLQRRMRARQLSKRAHEDGEGGDGDAPDQRERVVSVCTELAFATDEAERDRLIALLTATLHEGNILLDPESDAAELQSLGDDVTADSLRQLGSLFDAADATDGLSAAVLVEEKPQRKVRTHTACGHAENGEAPADVSVAEPKPHKTCMLSRRPSSVTSASSVETVDAPHAGGEQAIGILINPTIAAIFDPETCEPADGADPTAVATSMTAAVAPDTAMAVAPQPATNSSVGSAPVIAAPVASAQAAAIVDAAAAADAGRGNDDDTSRVGCPVTAMPSEGGGGGGAVATRTEEPGATRPMEGSTAGRAHEWSRIASLDVRAGITAAVAGCDRPLMPSLAAPTTAGASASRVTVKAERVSSVQVGPAEAGAADSNHAKDFRERMTVGVALGGRHAYRALLPPLKIPVDKSSLAPSPTLASNPKSLPDMSSAVTVAVAVRPGALVAVDKATGAATALSTPATTGSDRAEPAWPSDSGDGTGAGNGSAPCVSPVADLLTLSLFDDLFADAPSPSPPRAQGPKAAKPTSEAPDRARARPGPKSPAGTRSAAEASMPSRPIAGTAFLATPPSSGPTRSISKPASSGGGVAGAGDSSQLSSRALATPIRPSKRRLPRSPAEEASGADDSAADAAPLRRSARCEGRSARVCARVVAPRLMPPASAAGAC